MDFLNNPKSFNRKSYTDWLFVCLFGEFVWLKPENAPIGRMGGWQCPINIIEVGCHGLFKTQKTIIRIESYLRILIL